MTTTHSPFNSTYKTAILNNTSTRLFHSYGHFRVSYFAAVQGTMAEDGKKDLLLDSRQVAFKILLGVAPVENYRLGETVRGRHPLVDVAAPSKDDARVLHDERVAVGPHFD